MKLDKVHIQHLRNLDAVSLHPSSEINIIYGANGSGKSSILEAIHYLGFGRSFRTSKHKNVVNYDADEFSVFCTLDTLEQVKKIGLQRFKDDNVKISIDGEHSNRLSDLVSQIPVQIFTPQSSDLLLGAPSSRRRFLDWGLFHVEQSYAGLSNTFLKILKQKNALLRKHQSISSGKMSGKHNEELIREEVYWDGQFLHYAELIDALREAYIESIKPHFYANLTQLLPEFSPEISYYRGWERSSDLRSSFEAKRVRNRSFGYVSVGPHKADIKIRLKGVDAAEVLSRGQLRMLVAALQLAQINHLNEKVGKTCVFLLDDIGAELDLGKREKFINNIIANDAQLFVTAIEKQQIPFISNYDNKKMFHVEHGHVKEEI
ncbi:DNA replication/repair protein RecF [Aestuariibacter sp. AA17]|uniref:DNA replication and repair protein RecF n=1 Tax=Fluctibacter corallii TaxID=2984329 RepID=A0ABT3AE83_9ALTE|nr:DNA replication/repair protein RecF [Aestuariibacter sp. AA17]MCV2886546.1 DNA replication/repair protein RecF [Aestuariibacter sp. AA17]